jgi:hypothetical protein
MLILYDLPDWLMAVVIVGTIVGLSYAGYFLVHRIGHRSFSEIETDVAMTVLTVIATVTSLLLAFVALSVWESFGAAEQAVVEEANSVGALARDLAIFGSEQSAYSRSLLREYADMVVKHEWPDMQRGESDFEVWKAFDRMYRAIGTLEPDTPRRAALQPEIWARTNELLDQRRTRLHTSEAAIPPVLWAVAAIGTALTIGTTVVLSPTRFHLWIIGLLGASIGLVFYLVVSMDRPFLGEQSIGPDPFRVAIENMERWDVETGPKR